MSKKLFTKLFVFLLVVGVLPFRGDAPGEEREEQASHQPSRPSRHGSLQPRATVAKA